MKTAKTWIPVILILMAAVLPAFPVRAQQAAGTAGTKEALAVVEKLITALGGRKAIMSIKDTTISGVAEIVPYGLTVPVTIYQKEPDKMRVDTTVTEASMTIIRAFDGRKGWMTDPQSGTITEMPDFMAGEMARQAAGRQALLDPRKLGVIYALKPKAMIEGRDYVVLEQTSADGHKTTFYLDPDTSLPYKTQRRGRDANGVEVDSESYSTDYRNVGGMMVPYAVRVVQNGSDTERITVTSVDFNTNLDDALFALK